MPKKIVKKTLMICPECGGYHLSVEKVKEGKWIICCLKCDVELIPQEFRLAVHNE